MSAPPMPLSTEIHDRDAVGMTYVYPVVSRRAGGVSLGINLNVNNACNWHCVYCQVPNLRRGAPPPVDMTRLHDELHALLAAIVTGDFMLRHVPEGMRRLNDIALSGNGEPTSAQEFAQVVDLVGAALRQFGLLGKTKVVLISNGSLMRKSHVKDGLRRMATLGGEVWFKLDSASQAGMRRINGTHASLSRHLADLSLAAQLCPTWLQTCLFAVDGTPPPAAELEDYLEMLRQLRRDSVPIQGILLYGLARAPRQVGAEHLGRLPVAVLEDFATHIRGLGFPCKVTP